MHAPGDCPGMSESLDGSESDEEAPTSPVGNPRSSNVLGGFGIPFPWSVSGGGNGAAAVSSGAAQRA